MTNKKLLPSPPPLFVLLLRRIMWALVMRSVRTLCVKDVRETIVPTSRTNLEEIQKLE